MPRIGKNELTAHSAARDALDKEFRTELVKVEAEFKKHIKLADAYKAQEKMLYEIFIQDKWQDYDVNSDYYLKLRGPVLFPVSYEQYYYGNSGVRKNTPIGEHTIIRRNYFHAGEILICRGGEPLIFPGTLVVCVNMASTSLFKPSREIVLLPGPQKLVTPLDLFNHFELACGVDAEIRKDYQVAFMAWQDSDKKERLAELNTY